MPPKSKKSAAVVASPVNEELLVPPPQQVVTSPQPRFESQSTNECGRRVDYLLYNLINKCKSVEPSVVARDLDPLIKPFKLAEEEKIIVTNIAISAQSERLIPPPKYSRGKIVSSC